MHFLPLSQDCVRRVRVMNQLGGQKLFKALSGVPWAPFSLDVISGPAVEHWERNKRKTPPFFRLLERYFYYGNKRHSSSQHLEIKTKNHLEKATQILLLLTLYM